MASPANKAKTAAKTVNPDSERMYQDIYRAISEQRLLPGTKLSEEQLAEAFGASRGSTRLALQALARDKVVTLEPNRGAFVAKPSPREARDVFEARKIIEVALAAEVVQRIDAAGISLLREHVKKETHAEEGDDRTAELRTSHDFHVLLAELYGNPILHELLRDLMARSALVTAIYERPHSEVCSHSCHADLVDLLEGDKTRFAQAMLRHIEELEAQLLLIEPKPEQVDLKDLFAPTQ
ncbi:GntR family transcriptional regulator [Aquipseudomonas ullengensis]|uniref:GntR family transcriptional regulator n=1 Tax=Aquipseudomonas ullengensis TaxID=2759166 RepID=A0A7W4LK76_9GAMM|nr:GntR family transcriptional regulator [Pseudomonas ullengensis]MBB2494704.1 GntR family transcriptional regulator [Pseudomonas ullengensis]